MDIFNILAEHGYNTVPRTFYENINIWRSWYNGKVKSFHNYRVYNGHNHIECERFSLGMAKKVCEDWANLLMNEKVKITLEGEQEQEFIDTVFTDNNFIVKINEMQEMKAALGTAAYIPRVVGATVDTQSGNVTGNADRISIDYCTADKIFPLSWENGKITECAFAVEKTVTTPGRQAGDPDIYLYIQIHKRDENKKYIIENLLYHVNRSDGDDTGGSLSKVDPATVPGFENMATTVNTGSEKRQFVIDRLNIANNVDYSLPMGIPVFANCIDILKGIDIVFDSYCNEFMMGKRRLMAKVESLKSIDGEPYFDFNDTIFYMLPEDGTSGSSIQPVDIGLRTGEHNNGIQDMLNLLSAKCGFGEQYYKFNQAAMATATQVVSENSAMFRSIKKHEIILEHVLIELCRILLHLQNTYFSGHLNEDVEITVDFDDSIIEDKTTEEQRVYAMLQSGLMERAEARALLMNEDEKTAKKALPQNSTEETLLMLQNGLTTRAEARSKITGEAPEKAAEAIPFTEMAQVIQMMQSGLMTPTEARVRIFGEAPEAAAQNIPRTEFQQVLTLLQAGLMRPEEARARILLESMQESAARLPDMESLLQGEEKQTEVE